MIGANPARTLVLIVIVATAVNANWRHGWCAEPSCAANVGSEHDAARLSRAFRRAAERVLPAVVAIETQDGPRKTVEWAMRQAPLRRSYSALGTEPLCPHCPVEHVRDGTGSGVIIDRRGFILTCHHVIATASTLFVRLPNGQRVEPVDVRSDPLTDLAVVRIASDGRLPVASFGNSDEVRMGDWVVSVGNPYGLGPSVSAGIVSATNRQLPDTPHTRLIQTDAASNPGNSGGALVNLRGELVGITEGGFGDSEGFQGIAFAIPASVVSRIARQLIEHGHVPRAYLGCQTEVLDAAVARHLRLPVHNGIIVCGVAPQSPADRAGIQVGDVLTHYSGSPIRDPYQMQRLVEETVPGSRQTITVFRNGENLPVDVRLELLRHGDDPRRRVTVQPHEQPLGYSDVLLGLTVDELSPEAAKQLGYDARIEGVLITNVTPQQVAADEGVCAGMVISRLNDRPVRNLTDYRAAMKNPSQEKSILMLVGTPRGNHFVVFHL